MPLTRQLSSEVSTDAATVATPVFSPKAGTYTTDAIITITDVTAGATIYYTTNGTTPTTSSTKYTAAIKVSDTETIKAIAVKSGDTSSAVASATYTLEVATPVFSPRAGTYTTDETVTITDATAGATIHYTTNGTTPTIASTKYTAAIKVIDTETIKAIAVKSDETSSAVASAIYTLKVATPVFSMKAGAYRTDQSVGITDATLAATIHYTTDGAEPTPSSPRYIDPIKVLTTETIKAIAVLAGHTESAVATATYTITTTAPPVLFSPVAGSYLSAPDVTISDVTPGATIHYTTDGDTPTTSSPKYDAAIKVKPPETIKAIALAAGHTQSDVASATYSGPVVVPDVVGKTRAVATTAITEAHLKVGMVTMQASNSVASGDVISQSPVTGTRVASGSSVNIDVSTGKNPIPTVRSLSPSQVTTGSSFKLTVTGSNFINGSTVQWNGANQATTFVNSTTVTVNVPASAVAMPTAATIRVTNPYPGGGTSAGASLTALWPKPSAGPHGYLVDVPAQAATRGALDAFGNPLFAAWNPTDTSSILSPGMKIVMWGSPDPSCPANTQGPMGAFTDASLVSSGYHYSPADIPDDMRFQPVPIAACGAASAGNHGPSLAFGDGSQIWLFTSSLGQSDALLLPWTAAGQDGKGANAHILDAVVTFRAPQPWTIKPWVSNGVARIATMAQVTAITAVDATNLTQVKQETELNFVNTACLASLPANQCQIEWQFEQVLVQSNVTDWSTVVWPPDLFYDPAQGTIPVFAVNLVPGIGEDITYGNMGLSIATSQGMPTQHGAIPLTQFDLSMSLKQLENAVRIVSAKFLNQSVATDAACAPCSQVFGASWNDPNAWVLSDIQVEQEDYDPLQKTGSILGGFSWLYGGAAP